MEKELFNERKGSYEIFFKYSRKETKYTNRR